jgi:hypothetical protein
MVAQILQMFEPTQNSNLQQVGYSGSKILGETLEN